MIGEFEFIKVTDLKQREIESLYINPELNENERMIYILKKGFLNQKISLISNLKKYFLKYSNCIESFFQYFEDKFLDMETELQTSILVFIISLYTPPYEENILNKIKEKQVNGILDLIIKSVVNDEKSDVSKYN